MASTKRASGRASATAAAAAANAEEPTKAELQRRMEEAREDISQTVEEIKDTVTEQYETVKETVAETFDWRAQFRKHSVAWSLGALAVGYVVGSGLAAALKDTTKQQKGRRSHGLLDDIYAYGEMLAEEFSGVTQTVLLPLLNKKIKDTLGIDLSDKLLTTRAARVAAGASKKRPAKKAAKKSSKKGAAKKGAGKKGASKKGGS
ncbi:MAG TPA: hypothetical protein VJ715_05095 [Pyrinomonadaceae bacterium]|nr:hypothetical protein [Pyrinomonadaceae bacterium]